MKFTSITVLALFLATSQAVVLNKKDDNSHGLAYDLDVPTLKSSEANNAAKTQAYNGATAAHATATENSNNAKADLASATKTDTDAKTERSTADSDFKLGNYKKDEFPGQEKRRTTAVGG